MSVKTVSVGDRLISCASYLTAGWAGLIFCVIFYFRKKHLSRFLRFNVFQSIFISLLYFVLAMGLGLICELLSKVPFINVAVSFVYFLLSRPIILDYSIVQILVLGLVVYMSLFSLLGKYPRVYWISKIIDNAAA